MFREIGIHFSRFITIPTDGSQLKLVWRLFNSCSLSPATAFGISFIRMPSISGDFEALWKSPVLA